MTKINILSLMLLCITMPSVNYGMENGTLQKATENKEESNYSDPLQNPMLKQAIADGDVKEFSKFFSSCELDSVQVRKMIKDAHKKSWQKKRIHIDPLRQIPVEIPMTVGVALLAASIFDTITNAPGVTSPLDKKQYFYPIMKASGIFLGTYFMLGLYGFLAEYSYKLPAGRWTDPSFTINIPYRYGYSKEAKNLLQATKQNSVDSKNQQKL